MLEIRRIIRVTGSDRYMNPPCLCSILASFTCVLFRFFFLLVVIWRISAGALCRADFWTEQYYADMIVNSSRTHTNPNAAWLGCANTSWMVTLAQSWCWLLGHRIGWVLGTISLTLVQLWISDGISQPANSSWWYDGMSCIWSEPEDCQSLTTLSMDSIIARKGAQKSLENTMM